MAFTIVKSPLAMADYSLNWANNLLQNYGGDTLATSNWTVDQAGLIIVSANINISTGTTTVKVSGGTDLTTYILTNVVTTVGGRTLTDTVTVICQQ